MKEVYIEYKENSHYPQENYNPSFMYPEYKYGDKFINNDTNDIYEMIRNIFIKNKFDYENIGKKNWNPLKKYIKPGDTVLIKPNQVMHENHNKKDSLDSLLTHPSCIRALCDYCLIALEGQGKVIVADAPMQDCDYELLNKKSGYNKVKEFYKAQNEPVEFRDLRQYQSVFNKNKVIIRKINNTYNKETQVEINNDSLHNRKKSNYKYQVDNYSEKETQKFHSNNRHVYSLNALALEADVIINMPKPKTHRLAGITGAMKNFIGLIYDKASLPHRVGGSTEEGGDSYKYKSKIKKIIDNILENKIKHENNNQFGKATIDRYMYGLCVYLERFFSKDKYIKGIWYGNDTIWRTIVDINYIMRFSDKTGNICDNPQRVILNIADMIIAGEKNGPCAPTSKEVNMILFSENQVAMDFVICKIMGFSYNQIPLLNAYQNGEVDNLLNYKKEKINIKSNQIRWNGQLNNISFEKKFHFEPHDTWKEVLKNGSL